MAVGLVQEALAAAEEAEVAAVSGAAGTGL